MPSQAPPPGYTLSPQGIAMPVDLHAAETVSTSDLRSPTAWLNTWAAGGRTQAGVAVGSEGALSLATYYACVRNISEDLGKLPFIVYERLQPRGKQRMQAHPLFPLLHDAPNRDMTAMDFKQLLTFWTLSWGNGYAEIVRDNRGGIAALYPIHPSRVVARRVDGEIVYDVYSQALQLERRQVAGVRFAQDEILHLKGLSPDGFTGYSIFRIAAESLGLALAAQTFGAAFFGNGTRMGGVLEHPAQLSGTALTHLRESFAELYGGPENAGKPMILEEGMKWTRLGIPPDEAQFLETRRFEVEDVARWFRMPLHKVQDLTNAHFTNIESQNLEYVTDTLLPWMTRWEQECKRKLFTEEPDHFAEFLVLGLLRGDQASRIAYFKGRFEMGSLSQDELREIENENPLPDGLGSHYWLAANNYASLEAMVKAINQPPAAPAFTPQPPLRNGSNGHAHQKEVPVAP